LGCKMYWWIKKMSSKFLGQMYKLTIFLTDKYLQ
jgi:hypothetical protein